VLVALAEPDPLTKVFSALADPIRRDMVARLTEADATVSELAEPYDVTVQAVSKHVKVLEDAGLVTRSREAQRRPVHLDAEVFDLMAAWIERYRRRAEERYRRLDAVLDSLPDDIEPIPPESHIIQGGPLMTTTQRHDTEIVADPNVPAIHITREFDASPAKVFRAHTDRELFEQWVGPNEVATRIDEWDCRTGGAYRYVSIHEGEEYGFYGSFHEVRPSECIVQTFTFEGVPDGVSLERMVFEDLGDGRTRLVATSLCDSFEARDAMLVSGMDVGVNDGYAKLDELLDYSVVKGQLGKWGSGGERRGQIGDWRSVRRRGWCRRGRSIGRCRVGRGVGSRGWSFGRGGGCRGGGGCRRWWGRRGRRGGGGRVRGSGCCRSGGRRRCGGGWRGRRGGGRL
jgi:uncharacterized protein YndB with AHSA1/START domain/DNA-binding transcriptional ArsR family regulator